MCCLWHGRGQGFFPIYRKEENVLGWLRKWGRSLLCGLVALGVPVLLCKGQLEGCLCGGAQGGCSGNRNEANTLKGTVVDICTFLYALGYRTSLGSAEAS